MPPPDGAQRLRVGAWNVRRLGSSATDLERVAHIIEAHFDLVALVEVMHCEPGGPLGYHRLLERLGHGWAGQVTDTPRPNTRSPYAEYYAVLRRNERVEPCADAPQLRFYPDDDSGDRMLREPAFGCYLVRTADGKPALDFMLGVYHARWGSGAPDEIAREVGLLDEVLSWQVAQRPAERDLLLVGDFNLETSQLDGLLAAHDRTLGIGSTVQRAGEITNNLLDHLLVHEPAETSELVDSARVLDVRFEGGTPESYVRDVSDHLPIQATLVVSGDDD